MNPFSLEMNDIERWVPIPLFPRSQVLCCVRTAKGRVSIGELFKTFFPPPDFPNFGTLTFLIFCPSVKFHIYEKYFTKSWNLFHKIMELLISQKMGKQKWREKSSRIRTNRPNCCTLMLMSAIELYNRAANSESSKSRGVLLKHSRAMQSALCIGRPCEGIGLKPRYTSAS